MTHLLLFECTLYPKKIFKKYTNNINVEDDGLQTESHGATGGITY